MFKQAAQLKLRFQTNKGVVSTEQLWDLSQTDLASSIKAVKKILVKNDDDELSFLTDTGSTVDVENTLRFNILKDVYLTKKKYQEELRDKHATEEHNKKILALISDKQEDALKGKTIEELEALLK